MTDPIRFIHDLRWEDIPAQVQAQTKLALLDLIGVAVGGLSTRLSQIIRDHAAEDFPGRAAMLFDSRTSSLPGAAMAAGMTIDSLDGHDGFNPAKGHIGCPLFPAALVIAADQNASGRAFLTTIAMGYEFGARAAMAQHGTVPDYHTSGSWGAVTAAAACARLMGLGHDQTRHALGIAEYHGPRSQMMRCIDHQTMLKDGSGWGAMAGVSAVQMARRGFTGAPAITVEDAPEFWADLGSRWYGLEQYYKPYPVCRWAQAPVEGIIALREAYNISADMVDHIEVETFHESVRLATARPRNTEEAQYSTSFPCAVAMLHGQVTPADIADDALGDPDLLRLSESLVMRESDHANSLFPTTRLARVSLHLRNGSRIDGDWREPKWDHTAPPTPDELRAKFHALADHRLGQVRSNAIEQAIDSLPEIPLTDLSKHLFSAG